MFVSAFKLYNIGNYPYLQSLLVTKKALLVKTSSEILIEQYCDKIMYLKNLQPAANDVETHSLSTISNYDNFVRFAI